MNKEQIVKQIEDSFNQYKGSNEAIDDAAFYIAAKFEELNATQSNTPEWTSQCQCGQSRRGETWCCNDCGKPVATQSNEVVTEEEIERDLWAFRKDAMSWIDDLDSYKIFEQQLLKIINAMHRKPSEGWVKCSERLPEVKGHAGTYKSSDLVLVAGTRFNVPMIASFQTGVSKEDNWQQWYSYNDDCVVSDITHWQPLPTPPKTEKP